LTISRACSRRIAMWSFGRALGLWELLPIFQLIHDKGGVPEAEPYQVFNMGIGMVIIVAADKADVMGRGKTRVV